MYKITSLDIGVYELLEVTVNSNIVVGDIFLVFFYMKIFLSLGKANIQCQL